MSDPGGLLAVARDEGVPATAAYVISDRLTDHGWEQHWTDPVFREAVPRVARAVAEGFA